MHRAGRRWLAALALAAGCAQAQPERWDLGDLYASPEAWENAAAVLRERAAALPRLQAHVARDAAGLREALLAASDLRRELGRLWTYANLQGDEDLRSAAAQERRQRAQQLQTQVAEASAWLAPAVQALGRERVDAFVAADPVLRRRFDTWLADTLRRAPHTLDAEGERLLAGVGMVLQQPAVLFQQMSDAELPLPVLRLADGRRVRLTTPAFELHRASPVRSDRQRVFDAFFGAYLRAEGSFGANLATEVMGNVFTARARRHDSALQAALFDDAMPVAVYDTLLREAHAGLPVLHRYLRLRKRLLGIRGAMGYHDNYAPLAPVPRGLRWDLPRAKAVTLQALAPLGEDYTGLLRQGFAARWADIHPRPGKASGAYMSNGAYDVHPYLLLNHNDDFDSLSTLAHEWGHAVHTLLANAAQPYDKADYATFIAESASIGNEMLLADHLIGSARTREERRFYLVQALEMIRTTFFRQVMFAEFQRRIHDEVEQGRALSGARLTELYCGIARRYYGQDEGVMRIAASHCVEWAYVSHFFSGFYVWQYATSTAGAAQFADAIAREGAPARERFLNLLRAGGSAPPYALYVKAGVDLARPEPYQALMRRMAGLIDQLERLAGPRGSIGP